MSELPYSVWPALAKHAESLKQRRLLDLFSDQPNRTDELCIQAAGITLDYSKNFFTNDTEGLLEQLFEQADLAAQRDKMFTGEHINNTEDRAALHTLLRADTAPKGLEAPYAEVIETLERIEVMSDRIRSGDWCGFDGSPIKQLLHLGIGGSYLGPKMVDEALTSDQDISCHYVANVDAHHLHHVLDQLNPSETLVIVVSKSFSTMETKANFELARSWLLNAMSEAQIADHLIAVTSNVDAARSLGIDSNNILPMWDWVGGRYSVWSAVGLPLAIRHGMDQFRALLAGAKAMDEHFQNTPIAKNMPAVMAFLSVFYQHGFEAGSHAVLPYDHRIRSFADHLQQLDMESTGKSQNLLGKDVNYHTGAIIWGGEGTNGQHAFHQLLHQGTRFVGVDFIATLNPDHPHQAQHDKLIASCFSQSQALMQGRSKDEIVNAETDLQKSHKVMSGNRPSNTLLLDHLDAQQIGALIALYEHKVFCQATLWRINAFDQWGVELGKELGDNILNAMAGGEAELDPSTASLLARYAAAKNR